MSIYAACSTSTRIVEAVINDPTDNPVPPPGMFLVEVPDDFDGVAQRFDGTGFVHDPSLLQIAPEFAQSKARAQRTALLSACDWTQMPDANMTIEKKNAWNVYRQALRDLPNSEGWPLSHEWPIAPT